MRMVRAKLVLLLFCVNNTFAAPSSVEWWLTTSDLSAALTPQPSLETTATAARDESDEILIDLAQRFQTIRGIGTSLEASTAYNLARVSSPAKRQAVLTSLFDPDEGVGFSLARITIGSSDFTPLPFYSYDDLPEGEVDEELAHFSVEADEALVLPLIRGALNASSGGLELFSSPWSPPAWMKSSGKLEGGSLLPEYRATFARYLVRFFEEYAARGIPVHATTIQNEPLMQSDAYPTAGLLPEAEAEIITELYRLLHQSSGNHSSSTSLAPPEIWCFDHNWLTLAYPRSVLRKAASFVDGVGFHLYSGRPQAMSTLKEEYPQQSMHFTEGSTFGVRGAGEIVEILRNWAESYVAWVTMLDTDMQPNPGPHYADPTMLLLDTETLEVSYEYEFFMYGQFSKFVRRGAVRVESTTTTVSSAASGPFDLSHVAFINDVGATGTGNEGSVVLVVANPGSERTVRLRLVGQEGGEDGERFAVVDLPAQSVATFRWSGADL